jgi:N-acetyl-anhydromuramyl-L-alanine amidase AmpD
MSRIFVWPTSRRISLRRTTTAIAIHCTATREGNDVDATTVDQWHLAKKWAGIGYHYLIHLDGSIEAGRPENAIGSHIEGHNAYSIGIVYVGGLDAQGRPKDTRTGPQKDAMAHLTKSLRAKYRYITTVKGHRDFSPDKDHDGVVERSEWLKDCPCFDVKAAGL